MGHCWTRKNELDHRGREVWRRDFHPMSVSLETTHPEITDSADRLSFIERGTVRPDVALHEFSHRQEFTVAGVHGIEKQFLERRTADPSTRSGLQLQE